MGGTLRIGKNRFDVEFLNGALMVRAGSKTEDGTCIIDLDAKCIKIKREPSPERTADRFARVRWYLAKHLGVPLSDVSWTGDQLTGLGQSTRHHLRSERIFP